METGWKKYLLLREISLNKVRPLEEDYKKLQPPMEAGRKQRENTTQCVRPKAAPQKSDVATKH
eukprot:15338701-Ditylum_brightwellii.AAC.1